MKNDILRLKENIITLIGNLPKEIGSHIEFEIKLPKGTALENIFLKGTVVECSQILHDKRNEYLLEISVSSLTELDGEVLQAYIKYLEREKQVDESYTQSDIVNLLEIVQKCREEIVNHKALEEYIHAKIKGLSFH